MDKAKTTRLALLNLELSDIEDQLESLQSQRTDKIAEIKKELEGGI